MCTMELSCAATLALVTPPTRILVTLAAATIAVAGLAIPAAGSTDTGNGGDDACTAEGGEVTAVRAFLTPTAPIAEDVAYNLDDPDAEDSPLELIRFPDESALWLSSGTADGSHVLAAGGSIGIPTSAAFAFTGPERDDSAISDSIVRLYCGLLDRTPDPFELEYWAGRYWNGLPLVTIAEAFTHSSEFIDRYGVVSETQLVELLYRDVLGRDPGMGTEALVARLALDEVHSGQAIVQFTESAEYIRRTGTVPPEKPLLPYPDVGSGRRVILTDSGQRVWLIDGTGELHKTHQVSGRRGIPGVGRFNVYSMSRYAWAPYDDITMEFMVRFARGEWPYGFHSIPIWPDDSPLQTPAQLGTHRSGGCVRQLWDDAESVFKWAEVGDRVIVIP